jgi:hypothetical protein
MLATLKKGWPLTSPRSMRRVAPAAMIRAAAEMSGGMPSVRARSFAVPIGRMPSGRPRAITPSAAAFKVPSPPPTATRSTVPPLRLDETRKLLAAGAIPVNGLDAVRLELADRGGRSSRP